jgi:hypothetical protein
MGSTLNTHTTTGKSTSQKIQRAHTMGPIYFSCAENGSAVSTAALHVMMRCYVKIEERIRVYGLTALQNTLNGDDPGGDVDKMYVPDEYTRALYKVIVNDMMVHLAAHALSQSTAMDVYIQWKEMYEGDVPEPEPLRPPIDLNDYDF